jgi:UDP-N-acetylmuramoyl-L-alanyl-D-glutamate--2,6-diaminopimelate ligase
MYHKFPCVEFEGKRLIWDLRQDLNEVAAENRRVFIKSYLDEPTKEKLRGLDAAEYVDGSDPKCLPEFVLAQQSAAAFGFPSRKVKVVAVTGTNGKSTTVAMLGQLFSRQVSEPVVVLGTLGLQIYKNGSCIDFLDTGFTTPDAPALQYLLWYCSQNSINYVVMEASSQGWSFGRLAGLELSALGFTNLSQDHLDYHGSMEAYADAKANIFRHCLRGSAVLHGGKDKHHMNFLNLISAEIGSDTRLVNFSQDFKNISSSLLGHSFVFDKKTFRLPAVGEHNLENLRVAFELFCVEFGRYPLPNCVEQLQSARGRLELCGNSKKPYVYIDYAHSPDAIDKSLNALKQLKTKDQKLWVVFGCGGDRDTLKRPVMGRLAERLADEVVLTSDNPRTEDPGLILSQIRNGMLKSPKALIIDRAEAIEWALKNMASHDILLIAGKGHEDYQILGTQKMPYSDFEEVKRVLG